MADADVFDSDSVMGRLELAFDKSRRRSRNFARLAMVMAGIGLLYMGVTIGVMVHLVNENNETCASRTYSRKIIREYIAMLPDWSPADQIELDTKLPEKVAGC
jgi:hypothetical protein